MDEQLANSPYDLDWGKITSSGFSENNGEVLHVFNFDVTSKENVERSVIFSVGKIIWSGKHILGDVTQKIVFDLRGQPISLIERARNMKKKIMEILNESGYTQSIVIEILI